MIEREESEGFRYVEGCVRYEDGRVERITEKVALEVPVSVFYDGICFNVLSCTPRDLTDLAYGVSFSNGIIEAASDIVSVDIVEDEASCDIDIILRPGLQVDADKSRLSAVSGLGRRDVADELTSYFPAQMVYLPDAAPIPPTAIARASRELRGLQGMHRQTGATHAAAFVDRDGEFLYISEDIGRHNAVDKLIGRLLLEQVDPTGGFVYLSSRCALELVNKVARYGIGVIATVSAPTSAVIDFATEANVALCAFARDGRFTIYTHPERIELDDAL